MKVILFNKNICDKKNGRIACTIRPFLKKKGNIYVHVRSLKRKAKDIAFAVTFM